MKISIIGSGNVATWFAMAGFHEGCSVSQIYSRDLEHAKACAEFCCATAIDSLEKLTPDSDLYIFSVKDDCLQELVSLVPFKMALAVHTAGSVSQDIFKGYAHHYGVLYPCQSISKTLDLTKLEVPLCVEGDTDETKETLMEMATYWSDKVVAVSEQQRFQLHLAAVFACNFSNALYGIAYEQMKAAHLDWQLLTPLIENTARKVRDVTPTEAQTGPARRSDETIMSQHLNALTTPSLKQLYQMLSEEIKRQQTK